jgi:hypothetical protein
MKEQFPKFVEQIKAESVYQVAGPGLKKAVEAGGLSAGAQKLLEAANIHPEYEAEKNPERFQEMRQKLNTEPGLAIANHPGYYDSAVILNTLERSDVKVVVSKEAYEKFTRILGPERLLRVGEGPREIVTLLESIKDHIHAGGLVVMYPTAGSDRADLIDPKFEFRKGLAVLIEKHLRPSDMVYSFNINPDDIRSVVVEDKARYLGASVALATGSFIAPNKNKPPAQIRVDENYSQASEWLAALNEGGAADKNTILEDHFLEQFETKN